MATYIDLLNIEICDIESQISIIQDVVSGKTRSFSQEDFKILDKIMIADCNQNKVNLLSKQLAEKKIELSEALQELNQTPIDIRSFLSDREGYFRLDGIFLISSNSRLRLDNWENLWVVVKERSYDPVSESINIGKLIFSHSKDKKHYNTHLYHLSSDKSGITELFDGILVRTLTQDEKNRIAEYIDSKVCRLSGGLCYSGSKFPIFRSKDLFTN